MVATPGKIRSALGSCPPVGATGAASVNNFSETIRVDPPQEINNRNFNFGSLGVSAARSPSIASKIASSATAGEEQVAQSQDRTAVVGDSRT